MKYYNINTNVHNNNNNNDTYDSNIRDQISDIRMILSRLGKELYEIEKKQNLSDSENKEIYDHLVVLVRTLGKKEKDKYNSRDDLDYYGIRNIENLFDDNTDNDDNYYKPIFVKTSFKNNHKYYESKGDKDKILSVK